MSNSAQKRVFSNYSIGLISFIITFVQAIVIVPILLKYWGNDTYGIWLTLFAGFAILQTFDFGHQTYIGNLLNVDYHRDKKLFSQNLSSSIIIAFLLGSLELIITIIIIVSGYLNKFLGISNSVINYSTIAYSLISFILMWIITGSVGGVLVKMLIPSGYMVPSLIWGIIFKLAQFLSLFLVASGGGKILLASIVYSIVQTVLSIFLFIYIKNKMPEFFPWWKGFNIKIGFRNLKKSGILTLNNLLQQLTTNGLVLFITNFFSASVVPSFTTVRTLTNTATVFTNLFITSIQPDLIKYHAKSEIDKLRSTLDANWFFSGLVVNVGLILVLPFVTDIFKIWTKGLISFDFNLFISLAASISVINFGAGLYNYLFGINNLRAVSAITVIRVITLFVFSYYLSGFMGLTGIGVAVLISEIFSSMILPYFYVQKILKSLNGSLNLKTTITAAVPPLILIVFAALTLSGIEFNYYIWGAALLSVIIIYIFNWSILDKDVKERAKNLIHSLFKLS
jgi:O-antigen/teichoic acid export membrane protein